MRSPTSSAGLSILLTREHVVVVRLEASPRLTLRLQVERLTPLELARAVCASLHGVRLPRVFLACTMDATPDIWARLFDEVTELLEQTGTPVILTPDPCAISALALSGPQPRANS